MAGVQAVMEKIGEYRPKKGEFPPGVGITVYTSENAKGMKSVVIKQGDQTVKLPMRVVDDFVRAIPLIVESREVWGLRDEVIG